MKKAKYSEFDSRGLLVVDCTECKKGYNGEKSCSAGHATKIPHRGCCFNGKLLEGLEKPEK